MTPNETPAPVGMTREECLAAIDACLPENYDGALNEPTLADSNRLRAARATIEHSYDESARLQKERDDATWKAEHREVLFNQREQLIREIQGFAQKSESRAEKAEAELATLRAQRGEGERLADAWASDDFRRTEKEDAVYKRCAAELRAILPAVGAQPDDVVERATVDTELHAAVTEALGLMNLAHIHTPVILQAHKVLTRAIAALSAAGAQPGAEAVAWMGVAGTYATRLDGVRNGEQMLTPITAGAEPAARVGEDVQREFANAVISEYLNHYDLPGKQAADHLRDCIMDELERFALPPQGDVAADAARYRWLRERSGWNHAIGASATVVFNVAPGLTAALPHEWGRPTPAEMLDRAIDAAIGTTKKEAGP